MNKKEYQKLKEEAKAEYDAKVKALDMVYEMMHGKPPVNGHGSASGTVAVWPHNVSKRDAVRQAMKSIHGDFTMHQVRDALKAVQPTVEPEISDNALSAILSKLHELEELKQVRVKVGKSPAVYTNTSSKVVTSSSS